MTKKESGIEPTDDKKLLSLFEQNKDRGLRAIMKEFQQPVYLHVRRMVVDEDDARDVIQETFINVYRYLNGFKGDSKLSTWIYRIATNECIRLLKSKKKNLPLADCESYLATKLPVYDVEDPDKILADFQKAILSLPEKQRLAFNLRYYDELSYDEISKITDMSVQTLKTNYHIAKEKIKKYMTNRLSR